MADAPDNWTHDNGYRLNADGKSIEYTHNKEPLRAIVEAMVNEDDQELEYYTVIFDTSSGKPWETVEAHEIFHDKDDAQSHLRDLMETHA